MEACRIARFREAAGGGVLRARMALSAAVFQSVTTSATVTTLFRQTAATMQKAERRYFIRCPTGCKAFVFECRKTKDTGEVSPPAVPICTGFVGPVFSIS